jgi:exopolyphosphatase/guanosine-5'-triphosphate,3'-diphosphate pyrophosphatase
MPAPAARRAPVDGSRPDRAVIDIGSNTVRMVIYRGSQRAPEVWLNERVSARLGRDLAATGRMPEKSMDEALAALARYATILRDLGIDDVQTVATAAVRDAANGKVFLERVRATGLAPQLLTGEQEATASAFGVIGAFPDARGTVADLGGGSLELVMIEDGDCHDGCSLPLGTLRLPALRANGPVAFRKAIEREMSRVGWAAAHPGPLYMVGGTWRALAAYALRSSDHPLTDPHAFAMEVGEVDQIARKVARLDPAVLAPIPGISALRAGGLPDAAAMLRIMLAELEPEGVVFSSWGLREGLLFQRLSPAARRQDPLLAGVTQFAAPRGGSATAAAMIAAWTADAVRREGKGSERLRLAATILAMASAHVEPNWRARHAYEWAMDKRWLGIAPEGRACIAAALLAACGKIAPPPALERLASWESLSQAVSWGLAIRLCRRLGAGSRRSLETSSLTRDSERLVLSIAPTHAQLATDPVTSDLKALAQWLGLAPEVRVSAISEPAAP